jgi:protein TonB
MSLPERPYIHDPPVVDRPRYRAPVGLPTRGEENRRVGAVVSVVLHALIIGLLIVPFLMPGSVIARMEQGAGGAGPAGGGGGGSRGSGGTVETVRYVKLLKEPVPTPTSIPPVRPAVVPKVEPKLELPKPKPVETPAVKPPEAPQQSAVPAPQATVAAAVPSVGGGTGSDGSKGAGPGSGGGVGTGVGTGKGSANGPGTGGGNQANYPPTVIEMFLPPLPAPKDVKGIHFDAEFDVDSTGRVLNFRFTQTPNRDYNKRLAEALRATRFRPGTRPDGTPVRMMGYVSWDF